MSILKISKKTDKICPETLLRLVRVFLDVSTEFTYISGIQPFFISFSGQKYYVYIKNISSAYFEDRSDTTRAQLPYRPEFDSIKKASYPFIFLGYDADNDVMICWNYYIVKKRLNVASSVSFYSRVYFQEEVKQGEFLRKCLKNGDTPVLFKRCDIVQFFKRISEFFVDDNNSILQQYKENVNYQNAFEKYMFFKGLSEKTCKSYSRAIESRISAGISTYITKEEINVFNFKNIYILRNWLMQLFDIQEFSELDSKGKKMYSCALEKYIQFHTDLIDGVCTIESLLQNICVNNRNNTCIEDGSYEDDNKPIDLDGKLLRITENDLLDKIVPMVKSGRNLSAAQIVGKYYDGKYPNMKLTDWMYLVKQLNNSKNK